MLPVDVHAVVYTDLDHTLLGPDYQPGPALKAALELQALGAPVVPVTSKTAHETLRYARLLRLHESPVPAAIVEAGAALLLLPPLSSLAATPLPGGAGLLPLAPPPPPPTAYIPPHCTGTARPLSRMTPEEAARHTGLPPGEARLATLRLLDEAVLAEDPQCRAEIAERATRLGLNVVEGARFIHVTRARGKAHAVKALEELLGMHPRQRYMLGDSPVDRDLLELPGTAIVIPRDGEDKVRPRRADYHVAPHPAPHGWAWAAENIIKPRLPPQSRPTTINPPQAKPHPTHGVGR